MRGAGVPAEPAPSPKMTSQGRFKKDKEIIADYEAQVKGAERGGGAAGRAAVPAFVCGAGGARGRAGTGQLPPRPPLRGHRAGGGAARGGHRPREPPPSHAQALRVPAVCGAVRRDPRPPGHRLRPQRPGLGAREGVRSGALPAPLEMG